MLELKKDPFVILAFTILAAGLGVLCFFEKITWTQLIAGIGVLLAPSILGRKKDDQAGPPPVLVLLLVASAVMPITACGAATPEERAHEAEAGYTSALSNCAATEPTHTKIEACKARVRREWNVPAPGGR